MPKTSQKAYVIDGQTAFMQYGGAWMKVHPCVLVTVCSWCGAQPETPCSGSLGMLGYGTHYVRRDEFVAKVKTLKTEGAKMEVNLNEIDGETAKTILNELLVTFVAGDPDLEGSDCECCEKKRVLVLRLKNVGVVK